jgi:hypothetical protein
MSKDMEAAVVMEVSEAVVMDMEEEDKINISKIIIKGSIRNSHQRQRMIGVLLRSYLRMELE